VIDETNLVRDQDKMQNQNIHIQMHLQWGQIDQAQQYLEEMFY
jgi:hypothetical protein